MTATKQHDYNQLWCFRSQQAEGNDATAQADSSLAQSLNNRETQREVGVGSSGEDISLPLEEEEEEEVGSIQEEQEDTMQQGQCWVSKVHELQGTSGGRQQ